MTGNVGNILSHTENYFDGNILLLSFKVWRKRERVTVSMWVRVGVELTDIAREREMECEEGKWEIDCGEWESNRERSSDITNAANYSYSSFPLPL